MSDKSLKAYMVREDDEGHCVIAFATNSATARREGGSELDLSFEEVDSCMRVPQFDQYAPGPVPIKALVANGWWFECQHCGVKFDEEGRHDWEENERDDECDPVEDGKAHYCSPTCQMGHWAERRERTARQLAVIDAALSRWPMATGVTAGEYCKAWSSSEMEWRAQFTLPGIRYPITWGLGAKTVMVSQCDQDEFKRLYGAAP